MELHVLSYPKVFENETQVIIEILENTNCIFHIRKPDVEYEVYDKYLSIIPEKFHSRIIIHGAYYLINKYNLRGLHFSSKKREEAKNFESNILKSTSCHALIEVNEIKEDFDSCFLSPIFPSISKQGYSVDYDFDEIKEFNATKGDFKVIALGGIGDSNIPEIGNLRFNGAAVLGSVWNSKPTIEHNYSLKINKLSNKLYHPYCLSIAGFDPSSGAGVSSDIKTFEAHNCYGLGITTSITFQNDTEFNGVKWLTFEDIKQQFLPLTKFSINVIKIGLVENFETLVQIINLIKEKFPSAKIIWDPILKASAGYSFHKQNIISIDVLNIIDLITPNKDEYELLKESLITSNTTILLKGGHRKDKKGIDTLITKDSKIDIEGKKFEYKIDKHGTGCVLSSAIAANLALGETMENACRKAKRYTEDFIASNGSHLGYHNYKINNA